MRLGSGRDKSSTIGFGRVKTSFLATGLGALLLTPALYGASAQANPFATTADDDEDEEKMQRVSFAESGWANQGRLAIPPADSVLVDFDDDKDEDEIAALGAELGLTFLKTTDVAEGRRFEVRSTNIDHVKRVLEDRDDVESIELNVFYSLFEDPSAGLDDDEDDGEADAMRPTKPNDPMYKSQWHMKMVNAEGAWAKAQGEGVIVAVIDTGVSPGKIDGKRGKFKRVPDLKETMFVKGWNFVEKNSDPSDGNGHGTHVAGTIAQSTNNNFGVTGLAPKAKIMPIKVLSDRGFGSVGDIANGIRYAADNGAKVINMSLGGGMYSPTLARAVKYAHDKGVVVACAAGNGGRKKVEYPAAYPGAFAVSALGPKEDLAFYSSYGKETDIAAPGGDTRVDLNGDGIPDGVLQDTIARGDPNKHGFFPFQGTSMATPHVAGAAALVVSMGITDPDRVEKILQNSAKKLNDPIRYGAGSLDAAAAVSAAHKDVAWLPLGFAALLGLAMVRRNRKKDSLADFKPRAGFIGGLVMGATGLFFLRDLGLTSMMGELSLLAMPVADWPSAVFGQAWNATPLFASAFLPLGALALFFGIKKFRGVLAGFAIGVGGYLLARAFLGSVDVLFIPGHGLLDALWLTANGAIAVVLGRIAMMRDT